MPLSEKELPENGRDQHAQLYEAVAQSYRKGQIDPSYIISHRISLEEAPEMYKVWRDKEENVTKIVIDPGAA